MRAQLEAAWGAKVTEAMGIGDISVSLWGECDAQAGMHFSGRGLVHVELIDPDTGAAVPMRTAPRANWSTPTSPRRRRRSCASAAAIMSASGPHRCPCGRTSPRVRCIGRTDDMLIVRGVNVFPRRSAKWSPASRRRSAASSPSGRPRGFRQDPPLKVLVELGTADAPADLAERSGSDPRQAPGHHRDRSGPLGTLPRSDYKSKLVDWSEADGASLGMGNT